MQRRIDFEKYRVLSGSTLKIIAMISMIIDHLAVFVFYKKPQVNTVLFTVFSKRITVYYLLRVIGRFAFPLFCFLLTEGFVHTRNKKRYGINLLIFAFISEIPWDLVNAGKLFYSGQNVFFTLFLGFLAIYYYDKYHSDNSKLFIRLLSVFVVSLLIRSDYGLKGVAFILFLHIMRDQKTVRAILGSCFLSAPWLVLMSFVPIQMYNGKRGIIRTAAAKYAFYLFYPMHMLAFYYIRKAIL